MLPTDRGLSGAGRLAWRFGRPPGRGAVGLAVLTAVIGVVSVNVPGTFFLTLMVVLLMAMVMMAIWSVRFVFAWIVTRRFPTEKRWLALPAVAVLGVLGIGVAADRHLVLRATSPWMERDVKQMLASPNPPTTGWIGPLPVVDIKRVGQTLYFEVAGTGLIDSSGYAWSTDIPDDSIYHPEHQPLAGNWWTWERMF
jgi:hypothetical protein